MPSPIDETHPGRPDFDAVAQAATAGRIAAARQALAQALAAVAAIDPTAARVPEWRRQLRHWQLKLAPWW
jgi:hypothetical protein